MKHIKDINDYTQIKKRPKTWAEKHNIKVGDYVQYSVQQFKNIYHITKEKYLDSEKSYWLENVKNNTNICTDNNIYYWSSLDDNYKKLTTKQVKQIEQELLNAKFNI